MADVYNSGIYVQPMDFIPLAIGGGRSPGAVSGKQDSGEKSDKKKFEALQQQQYELTVQRQNLENERTNKKYETMLAIKKGSDPTAALNDLNKFLLTNYYPAIAAQDAMEALATRRKEETTAFANEVRSKGAENEPLLEEKNGYYDLQRNPTTGEVMTMGSVEGFFNKLSWSPNSQVAGTYDMVGPDGNPVKDQNGQIMKGSWASGFPNVPEPRENVFEKELLENIDTYKGIYNKNAGGSSGNMKVIGESYLMSNSEYSNSSNATQMQLLGRNMFQSLSTPAKEQLARDFWRDGMAGLSMIAKFSTEDPKTKKTKVETGSRPIINPQKYKELIDKQNEAQKSGDKDAMRKANDEFNQFIANSQMEYAVSRIWGKVDPAVSVQTEYKTSLQNLGNLNGNSSNNGWTFYDTLDNPDLAIAENIWMRNRTFVNGIVDEQNRPIPVVKSPVVNADEGFQSNFYKPALQNLFTNKGIVLKGNVNGKEQVIASISNAEAIDLNNKLVKDFKKNNPSVDWNDNQWKTRFAAYRTEQYNKYIFNKMSQDGKELMIPGSTMKENTEPLDEKSGWVTGKIGQSSPIPMSNRINPTWDQAFSRVSSGFPTELSTPITDVPQDVRQSSNMTGQQLDEDDDIYLGGTYMKPFTGTPTDRERLAKHGGDKPPIVIEILQATPTMPARDQSLQVGAKTDIVVSPERLKYMTIYFDGEMVPLDDERVQARFGIRTQKLNMSSLRDNAKTALGRAGYADKETIAIIPGWVQWKTFDLDRRYNTSDADARNRANETMKIQQNAFYNQQQQQAEQAKNYETN